MLLSRPFPSTNANAIITPVHFLSLLQELLKLIEGEFDWCMSELKVIADVSMGQLFRVGLVQTNVLCEEKVG